MTLTPGYFTAFISIERARHISPGCDMRLGEQRLFAKTMRLLASILIASLTMNLSAAETVIKGGPAKVSIPDRFVFERKTESDEGDLSGVLRDTITDTTIQYKINDSWGFKGLHPSKLDWSKVLHFERSPDGWYDQQFFVFEMDQELLVEARYGFQRCMFTVKVPKNGDYRKCIEVLRLIKVALNDGWILTRGKAFDEFTVKPLK